METSYPVFRYDTWDCALQEWCETLEREAILTIVKNTNTKLFLAIIYTSNGAISFPSGGIDEGDTKETTVKKELIEETWIKEILSIMELPDRFFEVQFYSPYRKRNNHRKTHVYYVETDQEEFLISDEERKIQAPHWMTLEDIKNYVTEWRDMTNYEAVDYLIKKIEEKNM